MSMNATPEGFLAFAVDAGFVMVIASVVLAFFRLVRGPTLADRVVALDMMTVLLASFCGLFAISSREPAFIDVAVVLALIGFLATVALARYAERRMMRDRMTRGALAGARRAADLTPPGDAGGTGR